MLLVTLIVGGLVLYDREFRSLCFQVASGLGFVANFALWSETGYFDTAAESKPLLHLWSLGIEEQFYIFWPLLLFGTRKRPNFRAGLTGILLVGSFAAAVWTVDSYPNMAFYSPWTRFWEILVGAAVAIHHSRPRETARGGSSSFLAGAGLLSIGAGFVLSGSTFKYPDWITLFPVLGAALVLHASPDNGISRRALAHPTLVSIGLLSYSLYLWHWPVLVFQNLAMGESPGLFARGLALVVVFALSVMTYRWIEVPVRLRARRAVLTTRRIAGIATALFAFGLFFKGNPLVAEYPDSMAVGARLDDYSIRDCRLSAELKSLLEYCRTDKRGPANALVIGDSKAMALAGGLFARSQKIRWQVMGRNSCAPFPGVRRIPKDGDDGEACALLNAKMWQEIATDPSFKVVLVAFGDRIAYREDYAPANEYRAHPGFLPQEAGLVRVLELLVRSGKRIVIVKDNPTLPDPRLKLRSKLFPDRPESTAIARSAHDDKTKELSHLMANLRARFPSIEFVDAADALCVEDRCPMQLGGKFLYSYTDHVSDERAGLIAQKLLRDLALEKSL